MFHVKPVFLLSMGLFSSLAMWALSVWEHLISKRFPFGCPFSSSMSRLFIPQKFFFFHLSHLPMIR